MELPIIKSRLHQLLGRDIEVNPTKDGRFVCEFADFNNPHPAALIGSTELEAYQKLLNYVERRPAQPDDKVVADKVPAI